MTAPHQHIAVPLRRLQTRVAQRGAALITSMVILLILTVIGITALGTTSLEQKMSVNIQEANRAFEAAESGMARVMNTTNDPNKIVPNTFTFGPSGEGGTAQVQTQFRAWTKPPRGSVYSGACRGPYKFVANHFDTSSTGTAAAGASVTLSQGFYQIGREKC